MHKFIACSTSAALFVTFFYSQVNADSVIIEAAKDAAIYADNVGNGNGAGDFFFAGQNGGGSQRRALIAFDLDQIPQGATITDATLNLTMSRSSGGDVEVSLFRLTSDWGEGKTDANGGEGGGAAALPGDATWTSNFFDSSSWSNPGGDFADSASATSVVGGVGDYSWSSAMLTSDVQNWLDGETGNFGWIVIGDESTDANSKRFNSRTNLEGNPSLSVTFTNIPEPTASMILIGTGLLVWRRRRKNGE